MDEKDRFGEKLWRAEQARERQWAAERDEKLLAQIRGHAEKRAAMDRQQGEPLKLFHRILCPIDFDENSLMALSLAGRLASQNEAELYLLHICSSAFVPLGGSVPDWDTEEHSAKRRIKEIADRQLHDIRYDLFVTTGDVAERVNAVQSGLKADLIVIGTHGRRGVPRFFLGSVAERVIREAACPVLTVRQDNSAHSEIA